MFLPATQCACVDACNDIYFHTHCMLVLLVSVTSRVIQQSTGDNETTLLWSVLLCASGKCMDVWQRLSMKKAVTLREPAAVTDHVAGH